MKLLVLIFWLLVIAGITAHFRKTRAVQDFFYGFLLVWRSILAAEDLDNGDCHGEACESGVVAGVISLIVVIILTLIFAGYTFYLVW